MDSQMRTKRLLSDLGTSPPKRSRWFTIDVAKSEDKDEEKEEKPILLLKPFSPIPHVCFDKVKLGSSKTCVLYLKNPIVAEQTIIIDKFPFDCGFFVEEIKIHVDAGEEKALNITWTPEKACNCRETIKFKSSTGCKTQAYLLGTAYSPMKKKTKCLQPKVMKESNKANSCNASVVKSQQCFKSVLTANKENVEVCKENVVRNVESGRVVNTFFSIPEISIQKPLPARQSVYFTLNDEEDFPDSPIRRQTFSIKNMLMGGRKSEIIPVQNRKSCTENVLTEKQFNLQPSSFEITTPNVASAKPLRSRETFSVIKPPEPACFAENLKYCNSNTDDNALMLKRKTFNVLKNRIDSNQNLESTRIEKPVEVSQVSNSSSESLLSNTEDKVMVHNIIDKRIYFGLSPENLVMNDKRCTHVIRRNVSENADCGFEVGFDCFSAGSLNDAGKEDFKFSDSHMNAPVSDLTKDLSKECSVATAEKKKELGPNMMCGIEKDTVGKNVKSVRFSNVNEIVSTNNIMSSVSSCNFPAVAHYFDSDLNQEHLKSKWHAQLNEDYSYKKLTLSDSNFLDTSCNTLEVKDKELGKITESTVQESFQFPEWGKSRETYFEIPFDVEKTLPESGKSSKALKLPLSNKPVASLCPDVGQKQASSVEQKKLRHSPFKAKTLRPMLKKAQPEASLGVKYRENPANFLPRRLNLKKQKNSDSVLSHRNPYASSNLYYDKRWMEKQEVAFTSWLNYILTPADSFNSSDDEVDSAKIWIESIKDTAPVRAPTKEELSLKTYTAVKNLNQLRKTSCMLYQSDEIAAVVKTVEKEVDMKRLSVRKDRALHADLGIKRDILDMLLSYNSLWLRIGLETIYGEIIVLKSNCDVVGLSRFIIRRLLSDPEITAKFSHTAVINYFKPGYEEEIKRFTLKKFLLLVYFLDIAKRSHLIKNDPCLFTKKAKYKCSRDLLHAFSRDYLSGEGDITKHLRYLGYKVSHEQTRLEEFDFSVKNIAVDLRCGLRLGRVVELIFQDWSISKMLRINTHSRLNKVHNNDVILKALQKASIEIQNDINPKDLVDGHREKTLDLLWQIVFKTQISKLLNKELLRQENAFLCRNLKLKSEYAAFKALRNPNTEFECSQPGFLDSKLYKEHEVLQLLLQWCQNVCAYYGLKVHNFTSSFSDGRALCFLLHHYHPNLLPYKNIKTETSYTFHEQQMIAAEADDNSPFHGNKEFAISMKELLKNEVHNLGLAFQKFQEIGQIPILSSPSDMSNTLPDEKVMITLVSYVNLRLMELSVEIRAARKILHAWRRWHFRKDQDKLKIEISAVVVIQNAWRKFVMLKNMKRHSQAAVVIQSNWRRYSAMKQLKALKQQRHFELLNQKATIIQACFKGYISRKNFLKCHSSAIVIQSYARMWLLKSHFQKLKKVTLRIQQKYRAKVIGHNQRLQYIFLKEVIIKLQSYSKGFLLREMLGRQRQAAIIIQSNIRMYLAVKKFKSIKNACLFIQQKFRAAVLAKNLRKQYLRQKAAAIQLQKWYRSVKLTKIRIKSAVRIQSLYRGYKSRQAWHKMLKSVVLIQSYYRSYKKMCLDRKKYLAMKSGFLSLQALYRGRKVRRHHALLNKKAVIIQTCFRRYISCKKYRKKKEACIIIQQRLRANIKMCITRQNYLRMKKGFVLLQALVRGTIARKHQLLLNEKATLIQSCVRSWLAQKKYRTLKRTCLWLQQKYRAKREMRKMREQFLNLRNAAITVQTHYRCYKKMCSDRNKYLAMKSGFLSLQALYRGRKVRRHHALLNKKAVIIQTCFRRYISCKKYRKKKEACIIIQQRLRANIKMRITRQNYLRMKKGFVLLQALVRGTIARKHQLLLNEKATLIQSCVRSWLAQKKYRTLKRTCLWLQQKYRAKREMRKMREQFLNLRNAAITVQTHYRCYKKMCSDRNKYLAMKSGFLSLQALYRGRKVRRHHALLNKKAVIIQTCFRRYISCKKYRKKKEACIIIQQRLRANIKMRITRQNYLRMKKGFILLQALVRGTIARKHQLLLNEKATLIQSCVRSWLAQKKYRTLKRTCLWLQQKYRAKREMRKMREQFLNLRNAAITVQTHYRCYKKMCSDRNKYLAMKSGFLSLQALYRGRKVRRHHALLNKKAVIIQTCFRRYISCKKYRKKKEACIIIQQRLRANIKMRITRQNYLRMKKGFVLLQALVRGTIARKHQLLLNEKATLIQSCVRSWLAQKKYRTLRRTCLWLQQKYRAKREMRKMLEQFLNLRKAAITVQTHYRCYKKMCSDSKKYLAMKSGFLSFQALYRGRKVRRHRALLNKKAVIIQTCFRRYISCKKYRKKKEACIIIQQRLRANIKMRITRQNYLRMKKGFVLLQALVRGTIARKHLSLLNEKAILIQSRVRSWLAQKKYRTLKRTCLWLQQKYRAKREMRKMREQFLNLRNAAITVQTHYRCYKKMCSDRNKYLAMKSGFLSLQALYRGRKVRRHHALLNKKAVIIQTCFRRYITCMKYRKKKEACIIIQQRLRANIKMRITRQNYLRIKKGFVLLQALVRGTIARKHQLLLNEKATLIQSCVRSWLAQKKYRTLRRTCLWLQQKYRAKREMRKMLEQFLNLRKAAITVQTHYRCYKKMCSDRNKYLAMKSGFLSFQALYRGRKVRRHRALLNKKAVIIQTCFRRYISCKKYRKKKEACIIIQQRLRANIKMRITRQNYLRMKKGFFLLQALVRGTIARKHLSLLNEKAILIQSRVRSWLAQKKYRTLRRTCLWLQQKYRAKREMRKMHEKFLRLKKAAITIQAAVRCHLARKEYVAIRDASIKVQSVLRMYIAKKNYKQQQKSAIFIQSFYRMHLARTKFIALKHSCIIIQSLCRRHIAQKRFFEVRNSAIVIQKYFFATKKAKEQRYHYLHKKHSAIIIQAYFRAYHSRSKFLKMKHSVIKIEQYYIAYKKMVEKKQNYLKMVKGFTQLQALVRGIKARKYISTLHQNAIVIQSHYRGWLARKYYQRLKAAIVIQRNFRLWKEKRFSYVSTRMDLWKAHQLHNWYLQLKRNVVKFQQCARLYLQKRTMAATVIQSYVRMWFVQREFKKHQAAKKIQAAWRGFRLRNSITNQEIIEARRKIKAADSSDSNKLKNRMIESLRLLFDQKLNYMIVALGHLDVCTQLSSDCCESLVSSGGLDVLLGLLQCCNRSVPHMEIIKLATNVLLNVAKYNKTVNHLWRAMPCLEVYLHLMKAFRETASEIFTKCCTLVWIFCQDPEKAKVIKQNTAATEQLISLHFLVSRKQMINEKRLLQKVASSARNSTFMSSRLCINKSRSIAPRESVEIEPDWMLGKQRRREFTDPLVAISSVLISLGLEAKKVMPKKT